MKNQALFTLKGKSKKLKCRLLQFLFGALRVKIHTLYCLFLNTEMEIWAISRRLVVYTSSSWTCINSLDP